MQALCKRPLQPRTPGRPRLSFARAFLFALAAICGFTTDACPGAETAAGSMTALVEADWIEEDRRLVLPPRPIEPTPAAAPGTVATHEDAAGGCDGRKTGRFGFHTASGEQDPWWQVDLGRPVPLDRVVIYNRTDAPPERTARIQVQVALEPGAASFKTVYEHNGKPFYGSKENQPLTVDLRKAGVTAQSCALRVPGRCSFAAPKKSRSTGATIRGRTWRLGRPADQKSVGPYSRRGPTTAKTAPAVPAPPACHEPFSLAHIRAVIERGRRLAHRLGKITAQLTRARHASMIWATGSTGSRRRAGLPKRSAATDISKPAGSSARSPSAIRGSISIASCSSSGATRSLPHGPPVLRFRRLSPAACSSSLIRFPTSRR